MPHNTAIVNLAIQFLPLRHSNATAYEIVDAAIAVVQQSGMKYVIGPFETTVEGPFDQVFELLAQMQEAARAAGAEELLVNMKLHRSFTENLYINDKTGKYGVS